MYEILKRNPLFNGKSEEEIKIYFDKIESKQKYFEKGVVAFNSVSTIKQIMFIIKGNAKVEQYNEDGSGTFLKRLKPGDVFGVLSIFSKAENYPTHIIFEKKNEVICISEHEVLKLIQQDEELMRNYLTFFNGQVQYLLNRIALFSIQNIEERVVQYFTQLDRNVGKETLVKTKIELSEYLGISRASLYRVMNKLEKTNQIKVKK